MSMKTLKPIQTYHFSMIPVLIQQIREDRHSPYTLHSVLSKARLELEQREQDLKRRQSAFHSQVRSRTQRLAGNPCFEAEHRSLLFAHEALNSIDGFLDSQQMVVLSEALADYGAAELHFAHLVQLRLKLPQDVQEGLQRAA